MTAAPVPTADGMMTIPTRLFGPLRITVDSWITFADGLLGFGGERRFVLLPAARSGLYWMQDIQDSTIAFLVADPALFFPDYSPSLALGDSPAPVEAVCIVTLSGEDGGPCSMNLQAPIIIDFTSKTATQLIADGTDYHTRHDVDLHAFLAGAN